MSAEVRDTSRHRRPGRVAEILAIFFERERQCLQREFADESEYSKIEDLATCPHDNLRGTSLKPRLKRPRVNLQAAPRQSCLGSTEPCLCLVTSNGSLKATGQCRSGSRPERGCLLLAQCSLVPLSAASEGHPSATATSIVADAAATRHRQRRNCEPPWRRL
jgi:hypothetical protein